MARTAVRIRMASVAASVVYLLTQAWQPYTGSAFIKGFSVAALAWMAYREASGILETGLLLSSIGDVLLDLDPGFVFGLCAFLTAHILYTVIFIVHRARPFAPPGARIALLFLVLGYATLFARWQIPGLGPLTVPVALYICAITAMVLTAIVARSCSSRRIRCWLLTASKRRCQCAGPGLDYVLSGPVLHCARSAGGVQASRQLIAPASGHYHCV